MSHNFDLTRRRAVWLMTTALVGVLGLSTASRAADPVKSGRPTKRAAPARKTAPQPPKRRVIVIDPGHGGQDPGAIGVSGFYEKNVVMTGARELARQLTATGRYRPVFTRNGDTYIPLRDRVARARTAKAELFISVHADSHPDRWTRGASVYTLSEGASDREAAALAAKENKSDIIAGVDFRDKTADVTSILIDLSQRDTINQSRTFAAMLIDSLAHGGIGLLARSHRHAGFAVLTAPDTPAVLLEMGYLSNPQDERLLIQAAHLRRLSGAVVDAVDRYFASRPPDVEPPSVSPPPPRAPARPSPAASKKA
ncbi:N-acetylmuramoyl-L-alanine amidase [Reyranella sp. CPCC 100927]|nr:N-acetylmuramoyl-L-alanine amidase [Reyranella sp. CPCC 100927]